MPTIEQEQTLIHTSSGDQEEVVCIVHSSPHATVTWLKNGQPIDTATNVINQRGNKHSLTLVDINEDMLGQYTCRATNKLGTVEKTTEISGKRKKIPKFYMLSFSSLSSLLPNSWTFDCDRSSHSLS